MLSQVVPTICKPTRNLFHSNFNLKCSIPKYNLCVYLQQQVVCTQLVESLLGTPPPFRTAQPTTESNLVLLKYSIFPFNQYEDIHIIHILNIQMYVTILI